jgi:hypothetical protein
MTETGKKGAEAAKMAVELWGYNEIIFIPLQHENQSNL